MHAARPQRLIQARLARARPDRGPAPPGDDWSSAPTADPPSCAAGALSAPRYRPADSGARRSHPVQDRSCIRGLSSPAPGRPAPDRRTDWSVPPDGAPGSGPPACPRPRLRTSMPLSTSSWIARRVVGRDKLSRLAKCQFVLEAVTGLQFPFEDGLLERLRNLEVQGNRTRPLDFDRQRRGHAGSDRFGEHLLRTRWQWAPAYLTA